jgi:peptidyl-prolyl cis-trans isomerase D
MVKPFNDFVFNSSIGSIGLVETFLIPYYQGDWQARRYSFGYCSPEARGFEATADKAFTQATKFEIEATEKILMLWQKRWDLQLFLELAWVQWMKILDR